MNAKDALSRKEKVTTNTGGPSILWAVFTRELVSDRASQTMTAFNIIEELNFPNEAFDQKAKPNIVALSDVVTFAFTLDWLWPEPIEESVVAHLGLRWTTPSGDSYLTGGADMAKPVSKPTNSNRRTVQLKIDSLPIQSEGLYQFDLLVNEHVATRYPVRIRAIRSEVGEGQPARKRARKKKE